MTLGLDNLISLISRLSHIHYTIDRSANEYLIAPMFNNVVVFIMILFSSTHRTTKVFSAKKLPSKLDDNTIVVAQL